MRRPIFRIIRTEDTVPWKVKACIVTANNTLEVENNPDDGRIRTQMISLCCLIPRLQSIDVKDIQTAPLPPVTVELELAGLTARLHRAQMDVKDAQEWTAHTTELRALRHVLEAETKTKSDNGMRLAMG